MLSDGPFLAPTTWGILFLLNVATYKGNKTSRRWLSAVLNFSGKYLEQGVSQLNFLLASQYGY